VDELVQAVLNLAGAPALRAKMGEQGRGFVTRYFDRSRLAQGYGVFLRRIAGKAPADAEAGVEEVARISREGAIAGEQSDVSGPR
jgi:hypothetical protein